MHKATQRIGLGALALSAGAVPPFGGATPAHADNPAQGCNATDPAYDVYCASSGIERNGTSVHATWTFTFGYAQNPIMYHRYVLTPTDGVVPGSEIWGSCAQSWCVDSWDGTAPAGSAACVEAWRADNPGDLLGPVCTTK